MPEMGEPLSHMSEICIRFVVRRTVVLLTRLWLLL